MKWIESNWSKRLKSKLKWIEIEIKIDPNDRIENWIKSKFIFESKLSKSLMSKSKFLKILIKFYPMINISKLKLMEIIRTIEIKIEIYQLKFIPPYQKKTKFKFSPTVAQWNPVYLIRVYSLKLKHLIRGLDFSGLSKSKIEFACAPWKLKKKYTLLNIMSIEIEIKTDPFLKIELPYWKDSQLKK